MDGEITNESEVVVLDSPEPPDSGAVGLVGGAVDSVEDCTSLSGSLDAVRY